MSNSLFSMISGPDSIEIDGNLLILTEIDGTRTPISISKLGYVSMGEFNFNDTEDDEEEELVIYVGTDIIIQVKKVDDETQDSIDAKIKETYEKVYVAYVDYHKFDGGYNIRKPKEARL